MNSFPTGNCDFLYIGDEPRSEYLFKLCGEDPDKYSRSLEMIYKILNLAGTVKLTLLPNFSAPMLSPMRGFVWETAAGKQFNAALFSAMDKFRVITAVEIKAKNSTEKHTIWREDVRKNHFTFPTAVSQYEPTGGDVTVDGGWVERFSNINGSSIGVYEFKETDDEGKINHRYFIVSHSGLGAKTLEYLNTQDLWAERGEDDVPLNRELFGPKSINHLYRDIAIENNRRLIAGFAHSLGVEISSGLKKHDNPYNSALVTNDELDNIDYTKLDKALQAWPTRIPIYPHTIIHSTPNTSKALQGFNGYELGFYLNFTKKVDVSRYNTFVADYEIQFIDTPFTISTPFVETVYNTFDVEYDQIFWYSQCAPTRKKSSVITFRGPGIGFTVYESVNKAFKNMALPVVYPFEYDDTLKGQAIDENSTQKNLCDYNAGICNRPEQLCGKFLTPSPNDLHEFNQVHGLEVRRAFNLEPISVYLASNPEHIYNFS